MIVRIFPPLARGGEFVDMYVIPPWPEKPKTEEREVRVWFVRKSASIPCPNVQPDTSLTFPAHVTAQLPPDLPDGLYSPEVEWGGGRFHTSWMCCIPREAEGSAPGRSNAKPGEVTP